MKSNITSAIHFGIGDETMGFARPILATPVAAVVLMAVLTCADRTVAAPPTLSSADTMEKVFQDEPSMAMFRSGFTAEQHCRDGKDGLVQSLLDSALCHQD